MNQTWLRTLGFIGLGLLLGIGGGLYLAWVAWPVEAIQASPSVLREEHRQDYTLMVASAYWEDGDLDGARRRLNDVATDDPAGWLLTFTVDGILSGRDETQTLHLVNLAHNLGLTSPAFAPYLPQLEARDVSQ